MNPRDSLQALFFISWFVFIGFGDHNFLLHFTSSISTTIYFHSILNHIDITWKWILLAQNKELKNRCMNNRKGKMIISCDMNQAGWKECSAPSWKQVSTEGLMTFKFYTMNTIPFIFLSTLYMHAQLLQSCLTFFLTSWTVTCQAPLSMGFSRKEYWIGLPFFSPEDLPDSGNKPTSASVSYIAGRFLIAEPPEKPPNK